MFIILILIFGCESGTEEYVFNVTGDDKLSKLFETDELRTKLFEYEKLFSQNSYKGDLEAENQVEFIKGTGDINILISAPHTTTQIREGKVMTADVYTGSMALLLQEYTGAHLIYSKFEGEDGNYVIGGTYKEKIGEIIKDYEIDLVLDIHGADRTRDFDLDIGTNFGETVRDEWVELLKTILSNNGIENVYTNHTFHASSKGTVTHHTWNHYNTEAIQLEFNRDFRDPVNDIESYNKALKSLILFVENVSS